MSDTRIQIDVPKTPEPSPRPETPGREARLISAPDNIRENRNGEEQRALTRVRGEVVRTRNDGSVRIQTERGTVDVKVSGDAPPPQKGERVEVEIRATPDPTQKLPKTVTIRPAPAEAQAQTRPTATPVNVEVQPRAPETPGVQQAPPVELRHGPNATDIQKALPPPGTIVRLEALPASVLADFPAPDPLNQITNTITQNIEFKVQILSQNIQPSVLESLKAPVQTPVQSAQVLAPDLAKAPILPLADAPKLPVVASFIQVQPESGLQNPAEITLPPNPALKFLQRNLGPAPEVQIQSALPKTPETPVLQQIQPSLPSAIVTQPVLLTPEAVQPPAPQIALSEVQSLNVRIDQVNSPQAIVAAPDEIQTASLFKAEVKPESLILQNQNASHITGVVTHVTAHSLPVITVSFPQISNEALFALQFPSENVTIGTQIQVTPQTQTALHIQTAQSLPVYSVPLPVLVAPQLHWPAMEDIVQTLARAAPQAAQAMMNVTPSPANPAQLGPAALLFIAAVRGGDLSNWLSDKTQDILRAAGKGSSISRLTQEGSLLSRIAGETTPQDWRALNIPMAWGEDIQKVALYYRHEYEDSDEDETDLRGTRFVFDLTLDAMGKVQLDGLFRPATGQVGRLDLAVRTESQFAESTKAEMRRIYAKALHDTQVTGELSFQKPDTWVTIQVDESQSSAVSA